MSLPVPLSTIVKNAAPLTVAGLLSALVGYGGTLVLVIEAANQAGLSATQLASWVVAMSLGIGISGIFLSIYCRAPIVTAWSTPGAAFLITALTTVSYPEAIAAYILSALAFIVLGLSGYFEKVIRFIPASLASALLAGVLAQFGIKAFSGLTHAPWLVGTLIMTYLVVKRFSARYAVLATLMVGIISVAWQGLWTGTQLGWQFSMPIFIRPEFTFSSALSIALPLFLVTLTGQYMPGMLVLRHDGFTSSANPILTVTGVVSLLTAPFGSHAINLAAITAAICTGPEAHPNPKLRWYAGVVAGMSYLVIGVLGVTVASILMGLPPVLISALAGIALLGTIGSSLSHALASASEREAALITFLATSANISLLGLGGAFWGLVIGLIAYQLLTRVRH